MKKIYSKHTPLMSATSPQVGEMYHVKWAKSHGVVGKCIFVDEAKKTVKLRSPKTGRIWNCDVKFDDLQYTRRVQREIEALKRQQP